ncbi:hypothetical protein HWV62_7770 [Athelia sp. TMB]|nr:hypothetical protein HWV62_7770 [Athelia sp. TMB]
MAAMIQQLIGIWATPANITTSTPSSSVPPAATSVAATATQIPELPASLPALFSLLLSLPGLRDWLKLLLLGSVFEAFRRFSSIIWSTIIDSFFITAQFKEEDCSYDWMMVWLAKQPGWKKAREVEISTSNFGLNSSAIIVPGEDSSAITSQSSRKLAYLPSLSTTYSIWHKSRWIQISRTQGQPGFYGHAENTLQISIMTRDHGFLNSLLLEAKREYLAAEEHNISIFISDSTNNWRHVASRPKRPLKSIVLDPGIKDLLIDDAKDFLSSKTWYADRGIPFRRGYLLYGAPGSGKTSMIHSLAGELGLDVYVISLSRAGLDDSALAELISDLPERCIALMEDIDAAFSADGGLERRDLSSTGPAATGAQAQTQPPPPPPTSGPRSTASRITLSGLLNAIDGIGAHDGRLLYATTNKYEALDQALSRPGRMDLHVEFKLASLWQASEMFKCFYLPGDEIEDESAEDSGYNSPGSGSPVIALVDLPKEEDAVLAASTPLIPPPSVDTPAYNGNSHRTRAPVLSRRQVNDLAAKFSSHIPEREFSMAALQGYLMAYKVRPIEAANEVEFWVERQRKEKEEKARLKAVAQGAAAAVKAVVA